MADSDGVNPKGRALWREAGSRVTRELVRLRAQGKKAAMRFTLSNKWQDASDGLKGRVYQDYESYVEHQALKIDAIRDKSLERRDRKFFDTLRARLVKHHDNFRGQRVLCLGARQGTEVRVFIDLGAFAVGIDLNPGKENRYVMVGAFHHLQFADESVDVVYTNALDHAFDLNRIIAEARRVLRPGETLLVELGSGTEHGTVTGFYESFSWKSVEDMVSEIRKYSFELEARHPFETGSSDEHLVLLRT